MRNEIFPGLTNRGYLKIRYPCFFSQHPVCLPGIFSPKISCLTDFHVVIVNQYIYRLFGLFFDDYILTQKGCKIERRYDVDNRSGEQCHPDGDVNGMPKCQGAARHCQRSNLAA